MAALKCGPTVRLRAKRYGATSPKHGEGGQ